MSDALIFECITDILYFFLIIYSKNLIKARLLH